MSDATSALIAELVRSTDASDPTAAMRIKARHAIELFRSTLGEPSLPINVEALASLLGISRTNERPVFSDDAELVSMQDGRVAIRVNPDRPETRRRFSLAHEISHTFLPHYRSKTWCRTDARYRRRENPDDLVEMLCDVGAAELIMPVPWFLRDAGLVRTGFQLVQLARTYGVSREAALRRFAEAHSGCVAAVFFSWKLKPAQERTIGRLEPNLFGTDPVEDAKRARRLRIDYSVPSQGFAEAGHYLPPDKSVASEGPLFEAAVMGAPSEGECHLDLGSARGRYRVMVVPLWTDDADLGPQGENGVAAVVEPLDGRRHSEEQARQTGTLLG
ncbi:MAG TPA: ImmA/IrrE family metallo-endopeptidase [Vicinamibacterales bacterium]